MHRGRHGRLALGSLVLLVGCAAHPTVEPPAPSRPGFSGDWVLQSSVPTVRHPSRQHVEEGATEITIHRTTDGGAHGDTVDLRLTLDGTERTYQLRGGPALLRAAREGDDVLVVMRDPSARDQRVEERWTLAADGATLTIVLRVVAGADVQTARLVYARAAGK